MASAVREPIKGSGGGAWNQGIYAVLGGQLSQLRTPGYATGHQSPPCATDHARQKGRRSLTSCSTDHAKRGRSHNRPRPPLNTPLTISNY
jgi:hypothetical protein